MNLNRLSYLSIAELMVKTPQSEKSAFSLKEIVSPDNLNLTKSGSNSSGLTNISTFKLSSMDLYMVENGQSRQKGADIRRVSFRRDGMSLNASLISQLLN